MPKLYQKLLQFQDIGFNGHGYCDEMKPMSEWFPEDNLDRVAKALGLTFNPD